MTIRQDLTKGNSAIGRALIDSASNVASSTFRNLGNWRDEDAERYAQAVIPAINGVKNEAAKSTVAFYSSMAKISGQKFTPVSVFSSDIETRKLRNGVSAEELFFRPFVTMRTALAQGKTVKESIELGAQRASYLASTEVQLARRNIGLKARNANDSIVGYIRTLTGFENCALCYVASTQRYRRGDLLPIHPGCDCGEMPLYGTQDPGQVIDETRLNAVHEAVESRFGFFDAGGRRIDYRKIAIRNNGELGPVLTVADEGFTGPNNLNLIGTKVEKNPTIVAEAKKEIAEITKVDAPSEAKGLSRVKTNEPSIYSDGKFDSKIDKAIYDYSGNNYGPINSGLRKGWSDFDNDDVAYYKRQVAELDKAFKVSTLDADVTLYRATTSRDFGIRPLDELQSLVGQKIQDKGFISTSNSDKYIQTGFNTGFMDSEQKSRQVVFVIKAPKGSKAIDLTALDVTANPQEQEILLNRNSNFKITKIYEKEVGEGVFRRTKRFIDMELISNE
jgi:hypothetical protein